MDIENVMNTLTGREVFTLEELIGAPLHKAEEVSQIRLMYALLFITKFREDKTVKWNDIQDLTLGDVTKELGIEDTKPVDENLDS